ncbi:MAG: hypothetical protein EOL90_07400 [Spartobacteria bacterium]|nr:hypothetical protein [Spartobacteria bacterium]
MNRPAYPPVSAARLEEVSSACTLSDMEIFVFPSLLYPLVLANLMSPRIWAWRDDPWFANFPKLTPYRRILRLKQFIMDHYAFNLDLETWGLTTQDREMARFAPFIPPETIARSNALFGYEGDQFYFDLDIRRHFGLDKYKRDVIPYWKTETVEAMDAFRHMPGHAVGAGECVSLSTLYAAALYVLCGIPLDDIFLVATPLHSQNFVDVHDGILTNNRRLVTKAMWFNGTELSTKARRALEHEQVTIVSHCSGWIHVVYPEAGIAPDAYARFRDKLGAFARTPVASEILFNFLRQSPARQKCFQIEHACCGKRRWLPAEAAYAFENSCSYKVSDRTRDKLLAEMDEDDFFAEPLADRIPLNKFDDFFKQGHVDLDNEDDRRRLGLEFNCYSSNACEIIDELRAFCHLEPRWPDADAAKTFVPGPRIDLPPGLTREEIIAALEAQRGDNSVADLAFYAFRDLARTDPRPFLKAAIERSPVCVEAAKTLELPMILACLREMEDESIYDTTRAAQPDEVWNAHRGDGFEKAVTLAAILHARSPAAPFTLRATSETATLSFDGKEYAFPTKKGLQLDLAWPLSI